MSYPEGSLDPTIWACRDCSFLSQKKLDGQDHAKLSGHEVVQYDFTDTKPPVLKRTIVVTPFPVSQRSR